MFEVHERCDIFPIMAKIDDTQCNYVLHYYWVLPNNNEGL